MPNSKIQKEIQDLVSQIRHHQHLYYIKNKPEISDREFDRLLAELQALEKKYPEFADPHSPSRMVGSDLESNFEKFQHTIPVLSLANTYSPEEAMAWAKKTLSDSKKKLIVQWKIDGATLVLYYKKGKLMHAVTRGSGQVGDLVTHNALTIRSIPHVLQKPVDVVVRGEVYMTFDDFLQFNEEYGSIYANPRNLTAGSLKHKKSSEVALRPIRFAAFEGHFTKDVPIGSEKSVLEKLKAVGLPLAPDTRCVSVSELRKTLDFFSKKHSDLPIPVDGLVLKVDSLSLRAELGVTAHSPRWAVALKFKPEEAVTEVLDVEFFTGRTGRVTPRARLKPVSLAGSTVQYATLHNQDYIERLGLKIGDVVRVTKRGDIIPAVEEVVEHSDGPMLQFPSRCPSCKTTLTRGEGAADWMCPNSQCPKKILNSIIFFCQRKQMDIEGMGERSCELLMEAGLLCSIPDIYLLHKHRKKIESLEGFAEKSADILLTGIEKSKSQPYRRLLPSLGLRELGHKVTEILIEAGYPSMESLLASIHGKKTAQALWALDEGIIEEQVQKKLCESSLLLCGKPSSRKGSAKTDADQKAKDVLTSIHGIGPRTAEAIIEQLSDPKILCMILRLKRAGLMFSAKVGRIDTEELPQIFSGQSWCVTGSFENFRPRDIAKEEIKKRGGKVVSAVSSKTTHLLAGEKAGSKLTKAQQIGTTIVDETEFLKILSQELPFS